MQVAWESNRERMAVYQWSNEELGLLGRHCPRL